MIVTKMKSKKTYGGKPKAKKKRTRLLARKDGMVTATKAMQKRMGFSNG